MDMPDGFIPLPPRVEPQAAFRPLLDDLRQTLARPPFERAVHSVYLTAASPAARPSRGAPTST